MLDRHLHHLPPAPAQQTTHNAKIKTDRTESYYLVADVEISNASHPSYTGTARVLDTAGRVERFERRYGRRGAD
ncbi:50S ribosomal protein L31 [Streptomyces flaveolus]|uniref:50S ribosomal protein L31 n=1 Tax=Streptomyces flaveolus TaxID=67297 RepID=UPI003449107A